MYIDPRSKIPLDDVIGSQDFEPAESADTSHSVLEALQVLSLCRLALRSYLLECTQGQSGRRQIHACYNIHVDTVIVCFMVELPS